MRNRFRFRLRTIVRAIQSIFVGLRLTLNGKTMTDPNGQVALLRGTNQGNWGQNYDIDAGNIKRNGANVVRILIRWQGGYSTGIDSYNSSSANGFLDPTNYAKFVQELDWLEAQGLWIVLAFDSDYGAGNRGLGTSDWNFFDTTDTAHKTQYTAEFTAAWKKIATDARNRKRILAYELLPEPLTVGANSGHGPILKQFYSDLMDAVRTVDPTTPFLIGGRGSYAMGTLSEVLMTTRSDVIYTIDMLTNKVEGEDTVAATVESLASFRDTNNVPVLVQQVGRNTNEDEGAGTTSENTGYTALNGVLSLLNAYGIPFTHWQYHQNTSSSTAYALWYKTNSGLDLSNNWTPKVGEINSFAFHMTQTFKSLEDAAIAAAIASGGQLFYVKNDLSNAFQDNAGTTAVTTIGQSVGRVNAVVGSGNLSQSTSGLRPVLAAGINGYTMTFDGSDDYLALDTTYFADGDDATVIVAGRPTASAANRVMFHTGNSSSTVRNPYLAVLATDDVQASWRGDDNTLQATATTTLNDGRAIVATAQRVGANKKVFLQGVQEGTTGTGTVGSIASITRSRLGSTTSGTNCFGGPISLLFVGKTVTDEQRRAISRLGAFMVGAPFRGAIPSTPNVYSARMIGGQISTPVDWSADPLHTDIMKRARSFALVNGTVPSGSVKYLEASGILYVASLARSGGVVTASLSSDPNDASMLYSGMRVTITCPGDPTFDIEDAVITVANPLTDQRHFTYSQAGADATYTAHNSYDIAASSINQCRVGAAGHPIEDFYAVLSSVSGSAASHDDLNGTYTITFSGSIPTSVSFSGCTNVSYTNGAASGQISISGTQSASTAIQCNGVATDGSFRVPTIVRTDHNASNYARPDFVKFLQRFGFLRFMDGGRTNNNAQLKSWAHRPQVASGLGMTIEQMVDLCNQVGCDMWYCFPVWATDDYIDGVCTVIKSRLRADLNVYFEHSNEVWNSGAFAQWHWMLTKVRYETNALFKNIDNINQISTVSRSGTTVTVTLSAGVTMPYVTGQTVAVKLFDAGGEPTGDANTLSAVITVTGASTFTYQLAGAAGAVTFSRASIYGNLASNLLSDFSITNARGPYDMIHRMHAKRTYQIAQRVKAIFDGVLNVRARMVLMAQMDDFDDGQFGFLRGFELPWLTTQYGPVNAWLWSIGGAAYAQAVGNETTHAGIKTAMNAYMDAMEPMLHGGRYIASLYGLEYMLYEGGPDTTFFYNTNNALVSSFFDSTEMQDVQTYNLQKVFGFAGADKYCLFQTSYCDAGGDGDKTWGVARSYADGGPLGTATAKRLLGIDAVLLAGKPTVTNPNVLPGTVYFQGGTNIKDELGNTFVTNGMRHMYNTSSTMQAVFYGPAGNVALTIWGKRANSSDLVKIWIDGVYVGTHALFYDGTAIDTGASGGSASPTAFTLPVGYTGWHVIKIEPPTVQQDDIGISKIVGV